MKKKTKLSELFHDIKGSKGRILKADPNLEMSATVARQRTGARSHRRLARPAGPPRPRGGLAETEHFSPQRLFPTTMGSMNASLLLFISLRREGFNVLFKMF